MVEFLTQLENQYLIISNKMDTEIEKIETDDINLWDDKEAHVKYGVNYSEE